MTDINIIDGSDLSIQHSARFIVRYVPSTEYGGIYCSQNARLNHSGMQESAK